MTDSLNEYIATLYIKEKKSKNRMRFKIRSLTKEGVDELVRSIMTEYFGHRIREFKQELEYVRPVKVKTNDR